MKKKFSSTSNKRNFGLTKSSIHPFITCNTMNKNLTVKRLSESDFADMQEEWSSLLDRSTADKLFLSWHWMHGWWSTYRKPEEELLLLAVYEEDILLGLAPLYSCKVRPFPLSPSLSRIQFIGHRKEGFSGFRSEYLQFLLDPDQEQATAQKIIDYIFEKFTFDELFFSDLVVGSTTFILFDQEWQKRNGCRRVQLESTTYQSNTQDEFDSYVKALGKNSRLQLFNRRKNLEKLGSLSIEQVSAENYERIFPLLTEFHTDRWGKNAQYHQHKEFIRYIHQAENIAANGIIVSLEGEIIGCTFDIACNRRTYNFQLGFSDKSAQKLSIGMLTLGYAIEKNCEASEFDEYDLLAGTGKISNYKARIANPGQRFESVQYIYSPLFRLLYRIKTYVDNLKARFA
ncbi:GNAT family N-acetyltransferase [Teredinibacter franksiae]|uniref:GNAT family N-acetyltransferase n=1 Tax=Teredinibacter franksiae TaxID=2761453 RepID=UPI00162AF6B3|nr:GNAT family N-acetyltransferase [Teredinibacter franksiae]